MITKLSAAQLASVVETIGEMMGKKVIKTVGNIARVDKPTNIVTDTITSAAPDVVNTNVTPQGEYRQDGLIDPDIIDRVAGSGGGPLIGS